MRRPEDIRTHVAPIINDAASSADCPAPAILCSIPVWVTDDPQPARDFLGAILVDYSSSPTTER